MARFSGGSGGEGTPGPQGTPGADGSDGANGLNSLFLGTWNSVNAFLAVYQGGPVGLEPGDWWAFVKDNSNPNKIYVVREDPNSATGWVIDDNEHFVLLAGADGADGAPGADGADGADGSSTLLKGSFNYFGDLDVTVTNATIGDTYLVLNASAESLAGNLWTWNGIGWTNAGQILGPQGEPGADGADGQDGAPGADGQDGAPGADALWDYLGEYNGGTIYGAGAVVTYDGQLWYRNVYTSAGYVPGVGNSYWDLLAAKGVDGADGQDGAPGADGADGAPGADGADGADGERGVSALSWTYKVGTSVANVDPGNDYLNFNADPFTSSTQIRVDDNPYGINTTLHDLFLSIQDGYLSVTSQSDPSSYATFEITSCVTGSATNETTPGSYVVFNVSLVSTYGAISNEDFVTLSIAIAGPQGAPGADGADGADGSDAPTNRIYSGDFEAIIDETGTTTFDGDVVPSAATYSLGTAVLPWQDIYVSAGSINIADADMETDSVSIKNTEGYLVLSRGGLKVTDNTNEFEVFQLNPDGTLLLKSNVTEGTANAALEIIGSLNGTSIDPGNTGVLLHITGLRDNPSRIYNDSYGTGVYSAYIGRHARGTSEDPEGLIAGDIISRVGGNAFLSSGQFAPISNVRMDFVAKENQTATARGNEIQFWTTEDGETTPTRSFTLENTGITFPDNTKQTTAAVAQVNSDWNATSGTAEILNKPDLSSITPTLTSYTSTLSSPNLAYSGTPTTAVYIATGKMVHVQIDVNLATVTNFGTNGQQYLLTLPFTAAHDSLLIGQCKIGAIVYEIAGKVTAGSNSIGLQYCLSNGNNTPNTFEPFTKQHPANMTTSTTFQINGIFISE